MFPDSVSRPRLKAHLAVRVAAPDKVFLLAETSHHLVRGEAAVAIVSYLDGRHTVPEIAAAVGDRIPLGECLFALSKFHRFGHLAEGFGGGIDQRTVAAWDARGVEPERAVHALSTSTVALAAVGAVDTATTAVALAASGLRTSTQSWPEIAAADATVTVVLTDDYLHPQLAEVDTALRVAGRPWLLAKPVGMEIWLGPYFRPGVTGCWYCLRERLDGNRPVGQYLRQVTGVATPAGTSLAALPHTLNVAAHLVAGAAATAAVTGGLPALEGVLLSFDQLGLGSERHVLIRQPQCPACGDPDRVRQPPQVVLRPGPNARAVDGGHRVEPPEATYRRLERHVGRLLGAVTSLRPLSGMDNAMTYSYAAGHNFAVQGGSIDGLRRTLRGQSGGKGRTEIQAKVSAVCEAIERYCGVWRDSYPTTAGSIAELGPEKAVAVEDLLLFSPAQYAGREEFNHGSAGRLHRVPEPLDPNRSISWTSGWSLTHERERLLPAAYTWFGHPDLYTRPFCFADANGNAAGNTLEEAILQGFCELVERDGVALWWYNRLRRPGLDLDSLADPYVDDLREFYAGLGRQLWVLDLTADLGIPTFAAVSRRIDHPVEDVLVGFGAHLDARVAVLRALTEVNQFLPAVANRHPDGSTDYWEDDPTTLAWWQTVTVADQPWLTPDPGAAGRSVDAYPRWSGGDLAAEVRHCVDLAERAGLEVIVCDQSRPDIELAVAKVVVPGMRHFWRRLAPGRIFDVPVRLGWLERPTAEPDCNPISVFF